MRHSLGIATCLASSIFVACSTFAVHESAYIEDRLQLKFRTQREFFGGAESRGFEHPATLSQARLAAILRGIEIEPEPRTSGETQSRPAVPEDIVDAVAHRLSEAFARAGPDQEIVVMALSKPDDDVIFKRKRLTSFVTFIKGDHLYVRLSKSNWPSRRIKTGAPLPLPWPDSDKGKFSVLQNELYTAAGPRGVRVPWRSSAFGTDGDTRAGHQRTERSPPRFSEDELADAPLRPVRDIPSSPSASTPAVATQLEEPTAEPPTAWTPTREKRPLLADQLETLPVEALPALVFLEETHNAGLVDDAEYRLKRAEILDGLRENPGSP